MVFALFSLPTAKEEPVLQPSPFPVIEPAGLSSSTATTCEIARELLQVSFQESIDSLSHGLDTTPKENIDSHLVETHERSHAHSACDKNLYSVLGQMVDRGHAPSLLVRYVTQSPDILDLSVSDLHKGVEIAVPEVSAKR